MGSPWDEWAPGVLNSRQMRQLLEVGFITYSGRKPKIGHSSMDLSLAGEAYEMLKGSVKPSESPYDWFITKRTKLARKHEPLRDGSYELTHQTTYVFRLEQKLGAGLRNAGMIYGQATAKSSVGRVDVLARLIVDGMKTYESFDPEGLGNGIGDMYLEITPITFDVRVRPGTSLSQLRLFYGKPDDVVIGGDELFNTIFRNTKHLNESLTVNLCNAMIGDQKVTPRVGVAFRSKASGGGRAPVPLWKRKQKPNPCDYWDVEVADELHRLYIKPDVFYILRSKEKLHVPKGVAIYCRASDETMGEMRIHYAGFVHPYFGLFREDGTQGTPLIFEVRGHQVPVSLADEEKMANLIFYRMSEDAPPLTKKQKMDEARGYGSQDLKLSNYFGDWSTHPRRGSDGNVEATQV
jgi:dCTP deaminase